jgi:hypothetical protein
LTPALPPAASLWPQVERLLCGVDAAVYLLDYTKLKTQEEVRAPRRLSACLFEICTPRVAPDGGWPAGSVAPG